MFPTATTKKNPKDVESDLFLSDWRKFIIDSPYRTLADWLAFIGSEGNKQGNFPVAETRKLASKISLKPYEAAFKVVVIWHPESLNASSGNALLKILEEPPPSTLFILVCSDPSKLLITILSRTQRINIPAVETSVLAKYLEKRLAIDEEKALNIALSTEGNISLALEKSSSENLTLSTWFSDWMRAVYSKNLNKLVQLAEKFDTIAKEDQKALLEYGLHIFRQCLYQISDASQLIKSLEKEKAFIVNFAKTLNPNIIGAMAEKISDAHYHLERNGRAKILHLDLSLNLIKIFSSNKK
jgi:DNA polymerase-3 subunit delta'